MLSTEKIQRLEALPGWSWHAIDDRWKLFLKHLQDFVNVYGSADVPSDWRTSDGLKLGKWILAQRRKRNSLPNDRRECLESVRGWIWDPLDEQWETSYVYLKEYALENGHCVIPTGYRRKDGKLLASWAIKQRKNRQVLTTEQIRRIESLPGWSWDPVADQWEIGFSFLKDYAFKNGNCVIPVGFRRLDGKSLGPWAVKQRVNRDALSSKQRAKLESLPGWSWDPVADHWENGFYLLQSYVDEHGTAAVPVSVASYKNFNLGGWVRVQRRDQQTLTADRVERLEKLNGWDWDPFNTKWEEGFCYLQEYAVANKTCVVPKGFLRPDGVSLKSWVVRQRRIKENLSPDQIARLEKLPGWSWDPFDDRWTIAFSHLQKYASENGNCLVPRDFVNAENFRLGRWVSVQRTAINTMSATRRERLDGLPGWSWKP